MQVNTMQQLQASSKNEIKTIKNLEKEFFEAKQNVVRSLMELKTISFVQNDTAATNTTTTAANTTAATTTTNATTNATTVPATGAATNTTTTTAAKTAVVNTVLLKARKQVEDLVAKGTELSDHIKAEFSLLEKICDAVIINATFDPTNQEDLDWLAGEIQKILIEIPEIGILKTQMGLVNASHPSLEAVITGLKSAGITTDYKPKAVATAPAATTNTTASTTNTTATTTTTTAATAQTKSQ